MSNNENTIDCPVCQADGIISKIPFDVHALVAGGSFSCPTCNSSITLGNDSKTQVEETLQKFEDLKKGKSDKK